MLKQIAKQVDDDEVMHLIKLILTSNAKTGIAQGSPLSPLLSNIYLNTVDKMLERARQYTYKKDRYFHVQYVRYADDLVVLIDGHRSWANLAEQVMKRLGEEFEKLEVQMNREKTKTVNLQNKDTFSFLGFNFYRTKTIKGKYAPKFSPTMKSRNRLVTKLSQELKYMRSWPIQIVIETLNPIIRGWVNYFCIGHSTSYITHAKKFSGKPDAGKPHVRFDVAGAGNGVAGQPRQRSTLPLRRPCCKVCLHL